MAAALQVTSSFWPLILPVVVLVLLCQTHDIHALLVQDNTVDTNNFVAATTAYNLRNRGLSPKQTKATKAPTSISSKKDTKSPTQSDAKTSKSSTSAPSFAPSSSPTPCSTDPRTSAEVRDILLEVSDASALDTMFTPQNDAYQWLVTYDDVDSFCPDDLIQRYIMAVLYYATGAATSKISSTWLVTTEDECNWSGVTCVVDSSSTTGNTITKLNILAKSLLGTIPPEVGFLTSLTGLHLKVNSLFGSLPTELGQLESSLETFSVSKNDLTGPIPTELGKLSDHLVQLDLSDNDMTGSIPTELGQLSLLTTLYLSSNNLDATLPSELGRLSYLQSLYFSNNGITGTIPSEIGNLSVLNLLQGNNNEMTGSIPTELGKLTSMISIRLQENDLTGPIPSELGLLVKSFAYLDLSNNAITGSIPSELGLASLLESIYLSGNALTSTDIPSEVCALSKLTTLETDWCGPAVSDCCSRRR